VWYVFEMSLGFRWIKSLQLFAMSGPNHYNNESSVFRLKLHAVSFWRYHNNHMAVPNVLVCFLKCHLGTCCTPIHPSPTRAHPGLVKSGGWNPDRGLKIFFFEESKQNMGLPKTSRFQ
jgi:hypothetical protein